MSQIAANVATETGFRVEDNEKILDIYLWTGEFITQTKDSLPRTIVSKPIESYTNDQNKKKPNKALAEQKHTRADYPDAGLGTQVYMNKGKKELSVGSV